MIYWPTINHSNVKIRWLTVIADVFFRWFFFTLAKWIIDHTLQQKPSNGSSGRAFVSAKRVSCMRKHSFNYDHELAFSRRNTTHFQTTHTQNVEEIQIHVASIQVIYRIESTKILCRVDGDTNYAAFYERRTNYSGNSSDLMLLNVFNWWTNKSMIFLQKYSRRITKLFQRIKMLWTLHDLQFWSDISIIRGHNALKSNSHLIYGNLVHGVEAHSLMSAQ